MIPATSLKNHGARPRRKRLVEHRQGRALACFTGGVPMLDPDAVPQPCHVAGREDIGCRGALAIVHEHAIVDIQTGGRASSIRGVTPTPATTTSAARCSSASRTPSAVTDFAHGVQPHLDAGRANLFARPGAHRLAERSAHNAPATSTTSRSFPERQATTRPPRR